MYRFLKKRALPLLLSMLLTLLIFSGSVTAFAAEAAPTGAAKVVTTSGGLRVRAAAKTSAAILTTRPNGSYVTLISKSGAWWYVRYSASGYGYMSSTYLKAAGTGVKKVNTSSGGLNVRNAASGSAGILTSLPKGTVVPVLSTANGWSRILYHGSKTGYVSAKYLAAVGSVTNTPAATYTATKLAVPSYKQKDSRWASVTLGSSGQSIGRVGCAVTSLAMTESFRTGTVITPDKMAKKLSFTSGGAVYWPTNYNIVTGSSGYLSVIYKQLKAGKPVIIGAKTASGSQHYVVVTGNKAVSTLSTSAFLINDPGSGDRITLAQFFAAYPYFYKMLYAK